MNLKRLKAAVAKAEKNEAAYVQVTIQELSDLVAESKSEDEGLLAVLATYTTRRGKLLAEEKVNPPAAKIRELIAAIENPAPVPVPTPEAPADTNPAPVPVPTPEAPADTDEDTVVDAN